MKKKDKKVTRKKQEQDQLNEQELSEISGGLTKAEISGALTKAGAESAADMLRNIRRTQQAVLTRESAEQEIKAQDLANMYAKLGIKSPPKKSKP